MWRYYPSALDQARAIDSLDHRPGLVLSTPDVMGGIAITTTRLHAVGPRNTYVSNLQEPAAQHRARIRLTRLMAAEPVSASAAKVRADTELLDVGLVCVPEDWTTGRALFRRAGFVPYADRAGLACLAR